MSATVLDPPPPAAAPEPPSAAPRAKPQPIPTEALALAAVVAIAIVAFAPSWRYSLLRWDDSVNLVENPHLAPPSLSGLVALWRAPYQGL